MDESFLAALAAQKTPTFATASTLVVDFLKSAVPLTCWAVTRFDGYRQFYLEVRDDGYGLQAGDWRAWDESLCRSMAAGEGPRVAADVRAVPQYATAGLVREFDIATYVGVPIEWGNGELFGTLCGLDPQSRPEDVTHNEALFETLAALLAMMLDSDLKRTELARALGRAESAAETDELTGLLNRRGWDRNLSVEEARLRRFGDPGAVFVIDLDGFKDVNDHKGHAAGDSYLASAAEALRASVRTYDVAARLGGDEFGVIATGLIPAAATALAARIEATFDERGVPASVGHAQYDFVQGLCGAWYSADGAMYARKRARAEKREVEPSDGR